MADDQDIGERTEPASPRKRQEAREKGQVARSADLNTAVVLLGATLALHLLSITLVTGISGVTLGAWEGISGEHLTLDSVTRAGKEGLLSLLGLLAPVAAVLLVLGLGVSVLQVGFRVSWKPLEFDLTKLDPVRGARRILSRRGRMRLVFGILKLGVVGWIVVDGYRDLILVPSEHHLAGLLHANVAGAWEYTVTELFRLMLGAAIALLALSILDLAYQRWQHEQDLRMTKQEVREELKRMEGDPNLKESRRRLQRQLVLQQMLRDARTADVVVTHPDGLACALRYDEASMSAPRLVALGRGHRGGRVCALASENGVPVVEEPTLAGALASTADVGGDIPADLYQPVADVLSYVCRSGGRIAPLQSARSDA